MLWLSIVVTAALFALAGVCFATWKGNDKLPPVLITFLAVPLFLLFMLFALDMNMMASLISGLVLVAAAMISPPLDSRQYLRRAAKGIALVYAVVSLGSMYSLYNRSMLRAAHQFDSVAERAAIRRPAAPIARNDLLAIGDDDKAEGMARGPIFARFERNVRRQSYPIYARRSRAIESLHQSYVSQFVDSFGFGVRRLPDPGQFPERYVDSNKAPSVPQPRSQPTIDPATPEDADPKRTNDPPVDAPQHGSAVEQLSAAGDSLAGLHLAGLIDFFNPNDFGYVKSVHEAAGFRPHHFKKLPGRADLMEPDRAALNWSVERLELVGLLLHEEPVVYVSDNLPKMEPGIDMPTRPLDGFELDALRRLESGEELATLQTGNELRVLGAIRAAKECLKCHQVNRGDLLGAFSYRLGREPPLPVAKQAPGPKT